MKKIVRLTESDLIKLVKRVVKESEGGEMDSKKEKAIEVIQDILKPSEIEFLKKEFKNLGKEGFKDEVEYVMSVDESGELGEEEEMSEKEYKLRHIIDKIITKGGVLSMLGVVPAAMFVSGGAAAALGVTALVAFLFKDAAFWDSKGDVHHKERNRSHREM
jgi:hypothetical protein